VSFAVAMVIALPFARSGAEEAVVPSPESATAA
jgi:hypothetical protein